MTLDTLTVATDDPCLEGHFPDDPLVPAVVILDAVLEAARRRHGGVVTGIERCKFRQPLRPGRTCRIELRALDDARIRFVCTDRDVELASGRLWMGVGS